MDLKIRPFNAEVKSIYDNHGHFHDGSPRGGIHGGPWVIGRSGAVVKQFLRVFPEWPHLPGPPARPIGQAHRSGPSVGS